MASVRKLRYLSIQLLRFEVLVYSMGFRLILLSGVVYRTVLASATLVCGTSFDVRLCFSLPDDIISLTDLMSRVLRTPRFLYLCSWSRSKLFNWFSFLDRRPVKSLRCGFMRCVCCKQLNRADSALDSCSYLFVFSVTSASAGSVGCTVSDY